MLWNRTFRRLMSIYIIECQTMRAPPSRCTIRQIIRCLTIGAKESLHTGPSSCSITSIPSSSSWANNVCLRINRNSCSCNLYHWLILSLHPRNSCIVYLFVVPIAIICRHPCRFVLLCSVIYCEVYCGTGWWILLLCRWKNSREFAFLSIPWIQKSPNLDSRDMKIFLGFRTCNIPIPVYECLNSVFLSSLQFL